MRYCRYLLVLLLLALLSVPLVAQNAQTTHTVQPGENLFRISLRYGVSMDDLAAANSITNRTRILAGQALVIPGLEAPDTSDEVANPLIATAPVRHTVQRGETLKQISDLYDVSMQQILEANNIVNRDRILAGQELQIWTSDISADLTLDTAPEALLDDTADEVATVEDTPAEAANAEVAPDEVASTTAPEAADPVTHVVQRGEHLTQIARLYGVNWTIIAEANDIYNANNIQAGQQLTIPGGDPSVADTVASLPRTQRYNSEGEPGARIGKGRELVVDLSSQMAYAYEDGVLQKSALVSTGLPATPTVQGDYKIWHRTEAQTMSGPGYYLPNVQWVMYFYQGYGFHGTYWHNNFGEPMSHGCVNMTNEDARWFYEFASIGTPVHVQV